MTEWQIIFLIPVVIIICLLLYLMELRLKEINIYYGRPSDSIFSAIAKSLLDWNIIGRYSDYSRVFEKYINYLKSMKRYGSQLRNERDMYTYLLNEEFGIEAKTRDQEELSPDSWFAHKKLYRFLRAIILAWLLYNGRDLLTYLFLK